MKKYTNKNAIYFNAAGGEFKVSYSNHKKLCTPYL